MTTVATQAGVDAMVFYLAGYTLMNLAAFAVIAIRERETTFGDDVAAVEDGAPGTRPVVAGQHLHDGRLARPVRAEQAEHLARAYGEAHAAHGLEGAVSLDESRYFYHTSLQNVIRDGKQPGPRVVTAPRQSS